MLSLKGLFVSLAMISLLACAGGEEKQILNRFFTACKSADSSTVAAFSLVSFPGTCESWGILEIGPEMSQAFRLPELRLKLIETKKERDLQYEKGKYYLEDNYDSIGKIQTQLDEDPDYKFKGKLGEVRAEWQKIVQERKELERKVQDINREMDKQKELAKMSLMAESDIDKLVGSVVNKELLVKAMVESEEKVYAFTLQRYNLTEEGSNFTLASRWLIVAIEERAP